MGSLRDIVDTPICNSSIVYFRPNLFTARKSRSEDLGPTGLGVRIVFGIISSGTFLFHAIRRFLQGAEEEGWPLQDAVASVGDHVFGMDLHPVAVVLAQVTYLLAIGASRTIEAGVPISIPVYLGDSMRWDIAEESVL